MIFLVASILLPDDWKANSDELVEHELRAGSALLAVLVEVQEDVSVNLD